MSGALYIGIDGGGSGCRAVVADAGGRVLGRGTAGPANIASDFEGALRNILAAAEQASAGLAPPAALHAGLGLAGVNAAGVKIGGAADRLRAALPFARARIESDAVTAVRGALEARDGIVAALGTGSVFAVQRAGGRHPPDRRARAGHRRRGRRRLAGPHGDDPRAARP